MIDELSATEKKLYDYIASFPLSTDVDISALYHSVYGTLELADRTRTKQQVIGAFISRINKKITGREIKPGRMKQTYRLTTLRPSLVKA